ncbi:MAG: Ig-like domain-containing protein [Kofleriaceae bacterium]
MVLGVTAPARGDATAAAPRRPRAQVQWEAVDPAIAAAPVSSHLIYLNRCTTAGCTVVQGTTSSTSDPLRSSLGHGVVGAFTRGDETWNTIVACMKEVYAPFNVQVTEVDPAAQPHFEIVFGGKPQDLGLPADLGGVSPFSCMPYIPDSVVFVFDVWGNNPDEICATAAQELAHSFALDHATEPSDPMTYFPYEGRRHYQDAQIQCGSDCDAQHRSPLGLACTGERFQDHACACGNGAQTQNDLQIVRALFGDLTASPPAVKITAPRPGDIVAAGFSIATEITDDTAVTSAELRVDGALVASRTGNPPGFTGPAQLADGTHTIEVTAYDDLGTPGRARVQVVVGAGCGAPADCPRDEDTCVGGRCVAGPSVTGGLGRSCVAATDCASWLCANDDGQRYCVEACQPGQCPSSFGCRDDGAGGGVCWPGFDDSTGGCATTRAPIAPVAPILLGLGLAAFVLRRRAR